VSRRKVRKRVLSLLPRPCRRSGRRYEASSVGC
jgi:hypothetical protein